MYITVNDEIDIQSQLLAENVLNRASILRSDNIQSFFPLCNGFSNCLNGDLLPLVFDCLTEVLYRSDPQAEVVDLRTPNPAGNPKRIKIWRI